MPIKAYDGIPDARLDEVHTTQNGKTYTIRCDEKLMVDMNFMGKNQSTSNSQGWERNSGKYFQQLYQNHPEMFSTKNVARIQNKQAPIVDQKMIAHNPQFAQFKGEALVHHHIGGDGQAVALPKSMHTGYGEIHNHEKKAGVTQNAKDFSQKCDNYAQKNVNAVGKTASEMGQYLSSQQTNTAGQQAKNTTAATPGNNTGKTVQSNPAGSSGSGTQNSKSSNPRSETVNNVLNSQNSQHNTQSSSQSRSQSVHDAMSGQHHGTSSGQSHSSGGQSSSSGSHSSSGSDGQSSDSNSQSSSGGQSK